MLFITIFSSCKKNEKKEYYFPNKKEFLETEKFEFIDTKSAISFEKIVSTLENLNYKSKKGYFKIEKSNENYNFLVSTSFGKCFGPILIKYKNLLSISKDSLRKGRNIYPLKDLKKIMKKDLQNFGEKSEFSDSPEKLVISVTCEKNELNELVLKIAKTFNEIKSESRKNFELNLSLNERMEIFPKVPKLENYE